jgi:hypothetical protein
LPVYYASRRWQPVEEVGYLGKKRVIMAFDLGRGPSAGSTAAASFEFSDAGMMPLFCPTGQARFAKREIPK